MNTRALSNSLLSIVFAQQHLLAAMLLCCLLIPALSCQAYAAPDKTAQKEVVALQRKIRNMEKRRSNVETQIELCEHKIKLHELCRNCHTGNCKKQGITGACRHWAMEPFGRKRVRVCHQLPRGAQRYSGIDQAVSSLENKIAVYQNTLDRVNEKITELEDKLEQIQSQSPAEENESE